MRNLMQKLTKMNMIFLLGLAFAVGSQEFPSESEKGKFVYPTAKQGVIDLRNWDFEISGNIELNGEWEFYWKDNSIININLSEEKAAFVEFQKSTPKYIYVPGAWNESLVNEEKLGADGFATYRLKVILPETDLPLGFHIYDGQGSAYELYVDNQLISKVGIVGQSKEDEKALYLPQYGELPNHKELYLIMNISNFTHIKGGFQTPIQLGLKSEIFKRREILRMIEVFLLGVLLIISLYHFSLYLYRRKDRAAFGFGLLCMVMALRLVITGERLLIESFPNIPFSILLRLEYLGFYGLIPPFGFFLYFLFPDEFEKIFLKIIVGYSSLNIAFVLFLPIKVFTRTLLPFHIFTLFTMIYIIYVLIRAVKHKREGARLFLFGFVAYFTAGTNDLIFYNFQSESFYILPFGLFVFIFAQSGALAHRIGEAFNKSEDLSNTLELKVEERTQELDLALLKMEKANLITEKQKKEIQTLNQFIKSLNENMDLTVITSKILNFVQTNFKIKYFALYGVNTNGESISPIYIEYPPYALPEDIRKFEKFKIPIKNVRGANALTIQTKKPWFFKKVKRTGVTREELFAIDSLNMKSFLMIPLILQGYPVGILSFWNDEIMDLTKDEITQLSIFGEQLAGIIYSSKLFEQVENEKIKTDRLLLNILPAAVATELKETNQVKPQHFESVSVLFSDFVGFTKISENLSPGELVQELDGCFSQFDEVSNHFNLEKLKTIGDAYMCAGGLPVPNHTHPIDICLAALEFRSFMNQMSEIKKALGLPFWQLRIGIHTGSVTAGVIGTNKFAYDIWGDTVNTASRMESSGEPGKINVSGATYEKIVDFFDCEHRGKIQAKGKGEVDMYFLLKIKPKYSLDKEGLVPNKDLLYITKKLESNYV
ncbi:adenylate/guanylate cyclase domain-containing protein [Leptospira sp. 96542]|nr:adenylate/guanylate cyclase domain-containing protein [Leptospira sp. 96542]